MKIEDVAKLEPIERFLYWIKERHQVWKRREAGKPKPWTDDEVLQSYFFTNPYRENDKTTVWFRENARDPMREEPEVLMATVIFRWFNRIRTGEMLLRKGLLYRWRPEAAVKALVRLRESGPVFTGAYMIKAGNGPKGCKVPNVCEAVTTVWKQRKRLVKVCEDDCRLQSLCQELIKFPNLGGFMSYEIVCDLRYTSLLENATDVMTWSNPGPGARRGLNRLLGREMKIGVPKDWQEKTTWLLRYVNKRLLHAYPRFEMREVEHSLCEWDKYERARTKSGKMKRRYQGR